MKLSFKSLLNPFKKQVGGYVNEIALQRLFESFIRFFGREYPVWSVQDTKKNVTSYQNISTVYSIINKITSSCANISWTLNEIVDKKSFYQYKAFENSISLKREEYRVKSMQEINEHEILDILYRPNPMQGGTEFIKNAIGFKLLTGNLYINGIKPIAGANKSVIKELYVLPSQNMQIVSGGFRQPIQGYRIDLSLDYKMTFTPEEILHIKNWNPIWENGECLYGFSPISSSGRLLDTLDAADTALLKSYMNNGAIGIISGNAREPQMLMSSDELQSVSDKYKEKFGGAENINKVLFTTANVKWQNMGLSPVDLKILESRLFSKRDLCDVYGIQSQLLNDPENKSYENQKEAVKSLYTDVCIPEMLSLRDELNRWLIPAYNKRDNKEYWLDIDTKSVQALKEDWKLITDSLVNAYWITPNQKRAIQGLDKDPNPEMDKFYFPTGIQKISE